MSLDSESKSWAIVIGIDEYGSDRLRLEGAVSDAVGFHEWVVSPKGGAVPETNVKLLLGRRDDDAEREGADLVPTKDNIVSAMNDVVTAVGEAQADKLYFYFSGHGITARVANRDEGALVTPGFSEVHPDHSLAIRSLTEHFETTPFADQFFFIDACRNVPWEEREPEREFEIGRWPIPRRRDPGKPPVQQFILYATSPGLTAAELVLRGLPSGAFTSVLLEGLSGRGTAKEWSWRRDCYEVRWERLASYVHDAMERLRVPTDRPPGMPAEGWPIQTPQDTGSRGVAGRDRDAVLASFPSEDVGTFELTLEINADPPFEDAELSVFDALGEPVALKRLVAGKPVTLPLLPRTYAARAVGRDDRVARVTMPIELYENQTVRLLSSEASAEATGPGTIVVDSPDPLGTTELRDEAGGVLEVATGKQRWQRRAGFYRVRSVGPEGLGDEHFVALAPGAIEDVRLETLTQCPGETVGALVRSMGGTVTENRHVIPVRGAEPVTWAEPSTIVLAGLDAALHGRRALKRVGLDLPREVRGKDSSGVAFYAVTGDGDMMCLRGLRTRVWPVGSPVPKQVKTLHLSAAGVAAHVTSTKAEPHWLSIEPEDGTPVVLALLVLRGRLATVVAQIEPKQVRIYQVHPAIRPPESSEPGRLRRMETLERRLLSGRLEGGRELALELGDTASDDPFAGCLAGYVLLRLGLHSELGTLVDAMTEAAPNLSDAHILRGELEAFRGRPEAAAQAFADAVNVGIPAFGEGLTRLLEGLRANAFIHPRGALVRHIFQRHTRGSMWAAFTPRRGLEPGMLVITGADVGFEG